MERPPTAGTIEHRGRCSACTSLVQGGEGAGLCAGCREVLYCSRACQVSSWAEHKAQCRAEQRRKSASATFALSAHERDRAPPALAPILALANAGLALAQYDVGIAYATGDGVAQSHASAFAWWSRCAAQPNAPSAVWAALGNCYSAGLGVARNEVEAVRLYRRGAAAGDAHAQHSLAVCCLQGLGVPAPDFAVAFALLTAAAAQDLPAAIADLGSCYVEGRGVARDPARAVALFERALAHPRLEAKASALTWCNLGNAYMNGDGVPVDTARGVACYRSAAATGDEVAASFLRVNGLV